MIADPGWNPEMKPAGRQQAEKEKSGEGICEDPYASLFKCPPVLKEVGWVKATPFFHQEQWIRTS
ncbi:MAG: hypothetical protein JSV70_01935 [bacterium]|nr:MAG: hypothetical protein JSV70_01935 [bacterium]